MREDSRQGFCVVVPPQFASWGRPPPAWYIDALTALDLLRYPQASAGIDNVATVLSDLGQKIDADQLGALSVAVKRPIVQRLGHLLDRLGQEALTGPGLMSP
jgi:hypothetical protein